MAIFYPSDVNDIGKYEHTGETICRGRPIYKRHFYVPVEAVEYIPTPSRIVKIGMLPTIELDKAALDAITELMTRVSNAVHRTVISLGLTEGKYRLVSRKDIPDGYRLPDSQFLWSNVLDSGEVAYHNGYEIQCVKDGVHIWID